MRFSLRQLFVVVMLIAVPLGIWGTWRNFHYQQLNAVNDVLAEHPEIQNVSLVVNDDVQLEVEGVYFSVRGQPDVTYFAWGIDKVSKDEFRARLTHAIVQKVPVTIPNVYPRYIIEYSR